MNLIDEAPTLTIALSALLSAQLLKFVGTWLVARRVDFTRLTGMGGMPSAHAASVSALSTCVGLEVGWSSTLFGAVAFFSLLIIYDAAGIRQAASRQAQLLNQMLEDLKTQHTIRGERLVERLGHTYAEVFVGAAYGVAVALMLHP
ncbi:MAG TPA: divergent PAP2 family protein [Longimicrobiales bacterium]